MAEQARGVVTMDVINQWLADAASDDPVDPPPEVIDKYLKDILLGKADQPDAPEEQGPCALSNLWRKRPLDR